MFTISIKSIFLIANLSAILSVPPGLGANFVEDGFIGSVYIQVKKSLGVQQDNNITMNQFYAFVGPSVTHINLVNGYFTLYRNERLEQDNINVFLFIRLIRLISIGTMKNPISCISELCNKFETNVELGAIQDWNSVHIDPERQLEDVYQFARQWLKVPDYRNLYLEEFFTFVGDDSIRRSIIYSYFKLDREAQLHQNNINVYLFKVLLKLICNGNGSQIIINPILFTNYIVSAKLQEQQQRGNREII